MGTTMIRDRVHDSWLVKKVEDLQNRYQELQAQYKQLLDRLKDKDISSFEELERHHEKEARGLVHLFEKTKPLNLGGRNFGFFGLTSTGKSMMINKLIGSDVAQTGAGETITKVTSYNAPGCRLFDVPGRNDDLSYFTMEYISVLKALTGRFVLITTTVKEMTKVFQVLDANNLRYDIVVNKFDIVASADRERLKHKIRNEIERCNLRGVDNVWFVSAKYPEQFPDWLKLLHSVNYKY